MLVLNTWESLLKAANPAINSDGRNAASLYFRPPVMDEC